MSGNISNKRRLDVVEAIARRERFLHWPVEFPELFLASDGVDVLLGNPPWLKLEWKDQGIVGDLEPLATLRPSSDKAYSEHRARLLNNDDARMTYLAEFQQSVALQSFCRARHNYPLLEGAKTNLYKLFLLLVPRLGAVQSVGGMFHQPGIYDASDSAGLRCHLYPRLRMVCRFSNALKVFPDIKITRPFAFSVLSAVSARSVDFLQVSSLYHPRTLTESELDDGASALPGLKDALGRWELRGHRDRLVRITQSVLEASDRLYDSESGRTPLPALHAQQHNSLLLKLVQARSVRDLEAGSWRGSSGLQETEARKRGAIVPRTHCPTDAAEWILSGPNIYVSNPFYKGANSQCTHPRHYHAIDLDGRPPELLTPVAYAPGGSDMGLGVADERWLLSYRYAHRAMVSPTSERTLAVAILPPRALHIHGIYSVAFESDETLLSVVGLASSMVVDFFVKMTGSSNLNTGMLRNLPAGGTGLVDLSLRRRVLRLNCLSTHYADLWRRNCDPGMSSDSFASRRALLGDWSHLDVEWDATSAVRSPLARYQAQVELDVLAALSLRISLSQLVGAFRVYFPLVAAHDRATFYDQRGRIVFTGTQSLNGVGLDRAKWNEISDCMSAEDLPVWARDEHGPFVPPFDSCDREADMVQAYRYFEETLGIPIDGES